MEEVVTKRNGPMHVHLTDDASLHLHIREKPKMTLADHGDRSHHGSHTKLSTSGGTGFSQKKGPWIPPPARTSKNYRQHFDDSTWSLEEAQHARNCRYEAKIQHLLNQLEAMKGDRIARKNLDLLQESQHALQQQASELDECKEQLDCTNRQLSLLQQSLDRLTDSAEPHSDAPLSSLNDALLRSLIECELACEAVLAAAQHHLTSPNSATSKQTLEKRGHEFQDVGSRLCQLLRSRAGRGLDASRWQKEKEDWQRKVRELEDLNSHWQREAAKRERDAGELQTRLHRQKEEETSTANMRYNLEAGRRHLEEHLEQKKRECDRLREALASQEVRSSRLERDLQEVRRDLETHLAQQQVREVQDASLLQLKEALRRKEQQLRQVEETLQEREAAVDTYQQEAENLALKVRQSEAECQRSSAREEEVKCRMESLQQRFNVLEFELQRKNEDLTKFSAVQNVDFLTVQEENQRLRHLLSQCELRLSEVDVEMTALRENLRHYENIVSEHRTREDRSESGWKDRLQRCQSELQESRAAQERLQSQLIVSGNEKQEVMSRLSLVETELANSKRRTEDLQREITAQRVQLDETLSAEKRAAEKQRSRESLQSREQIAAQHDLESEVARLRAELSRVQMESEEQKRRNLSRMQDLKVQLDQADVTNRSMQTYVTFLKRSYANVFGRQVTLPNSFLDSNGATASNHETAPLQFEPTFGSFATLFPSPSASVS